MSEEPGQLTSRGRWRELLEANSSPNFAVGPRKRPWPVVEVEGMVSVFDNGNGFTLDVQRIGKPRLAQ